MKEKIKKLQEKLNNILHGNEEKVNEIKFRTKRASGGIKRQTKGHIVEKIYSEIIKYCLREKKSKFKLINGMGNLPGDVKNRIPRLKVSKDYLNLKKLKFSPNENLLGYEDKFDAFIIEKDKISMVIEYKAYSESTMLKRCLVDALIAQIHDKKIKYCLCLLQSQIASKNNLISYNAHSLLSYFHDKYDVKADILILVKQPRKVNEDIMKKKYEINFELLENTVNYFMKHFDNTV